MEDFVVEDDHPPPSSIKTCHLVSPQHEVEVNRRLLSSGLCIVVGEEEVVRDSMGRPLVGGLFGVADKVETDRLINDRRVLNEGETRLNWAELPHGILLTRLFLREGEVGAGHGDDLRKFFYKIRHKRSWVRRNCFGNRVDGGLYQDFGGKPGSGYFLGFNVLCMGDTNAVCIAQELHTCVLREAGGMDPSNLLVYRSSVPVTKFLEGLYIDDHVCLGIGTKSELRNAKAKARWQRRMHRRDGVLRSPYLTLFHRLENVVTFPLLSI